MHKQLSYVASGFLMCFCFLFITQSSFSCPLPIVFLCNFSLYETSMIKKLPALHTNNQLEIQWYTFKEKNTGLHVFVRYTFPYYVLCPCSYIDVG